MCCSSLAPRQPEVLRSIRNSSGRGKQRKDPMNSSTMLLSTILSQQHNNTFHLLPFGDEMRLMRPDLWNSEDQDRTRRVTDKDRASFSDAFCGKYSRNQYSNNSLVSSSIVQRRQEVHQVASFLLFLLLGLTKFRGFLRSFGWSRCRCGRGQRQELLLVVCCVRVGTGGCCFGTLVGVVEQNSLSLVSKQFSVH